MPAHSPHSCTPPAGSTICMLCVLLSCLGAWAGDENLPDPTRPEGFSHRATGVSGAPVTLPQLSSVLIGDDRKLAVIDGRVMAEGDVENGVRVRRISSDRVVVALEGDAQVTLLLDRTEIHKEVR